MFQGQNEMRMEGYMEQMLQVGILSSTHGLKGEVKVFPTTDDLKRFSKLKTVFLEWEENYIELEITGVKYFKKFVIVKFQGIDSINDVEKYKGKSLFVAREDAVPLLEDEYFIGDLIEMDVEKEDGEVLGVIEDVLITGANDVYVVRRAGKKDLLIPAIKECIRKVDLNNHKMTVRLLDGLE